MRDIGDIPHRICVSANRQRTKRKPTAKEHTYRTRLKTHATINLYKKQITSRLCANVCSMEGFYGQKPMHTVDDCVQKCDDCFLFGYLLIFRSVLIYILICWAFLLWQLRKYNKNKWFYVLVEFCYIFFLVCYRWWKVGFFFGKLFKNFWKNDIRCNLTSRARNIISFEITMKAKRLK